MTVLFVATELADFRRATGWTISNDTSATFHDSNSARGSIKVRDFAFIRQNFSANSTEGWFHCRLGVPVTDNFADVRYLDLRDEDSGNIVIRIRATNSDPHLQININGTLTSIGPVFVLSNNVTYRMDIHWRLSTDQSRSPLVEFYMNETLVAASTSNFLNSAFFTHINAVLMSSPKNGLGGPDVHSRFSEIVVADVSTLDWRVVTLFPNGEGNSTQWLGTESTKVIGVNLFNTANGSMGANDSININTPSTNQTQLFTLSSVSTVFDDLGVKAVVATARCKVGSSGPQNVNLVVRTGGSNFFSSDVDFTDASDGRAFAGVFNVWDTNPNTSSAWASSEINSVEVGVRSRT